MATLGTELRLPLRPASPAHTPSATESQLGPVFDETPPRAATVKQRCARAGPAFVGPSDPVHHVGVLKAHLLAAVRRVSTIVALCLRDIGGVATIKLGPIGFIGLGDMGKPMACSPLEAGYALVV